MQEEKRKELGEICKGRGLLTVESGG